MDKDLLYRKEILDYYKNPMFKEEPSSYDLKAHLKNPSCGDDLTIYVSLDKEKNIQQISYSGPLCAISTYGAELACQYLLNKNIKDINTINLLDLIDKEEFPIDKNPVRLKCFLLVINTLAKINIK